MLKLGAHNQKLSLLYKAQSQIRSNGGKVFTRMQLMIHKELIPRSFTIQRNMYHTFQLLMKVLRAVIKVSLVSNCNSVILNVVLLVFKSNRDNLMSMRALFQQIVRSLINIGKSWIHKILILTLRYLIQLIVQLRNV